jgi:hypothetical protein
MPGGQNVGAESQSACEPWHAHGQIEQCGDQREDSVVQDENGWTLNLVDSMFGRQPWRATSSVHQAQDCESCRKKGQKEPL